jgi:acyl-coenzyme A synthetase/AMP-(fatty) acid ligase
VTTPFHLKTLLLAGVQLPPVELLLSATAPLSPQLAAQAESATGGRLVEIYGCTEAGQVASRRTTEGDTWTTLGDLRIAATGEQFVVSGGHVAEPTPLADVLELHDSQRFRLLGRANDLIHVAGKRSSLAHLNFHLNRIEGVRDGAFWLPEEDGEEVVRPIVFVVAPGLSARDIIAALRRQLEPAFVPRRVLHVAALPREATGKMTAAALRTFALQVMADPVVTISPDHPAFAGHFPGQPLLPGAVLLSLVTQALQGRLGPTARVDNAKFLAPVGPGAHLRLALREQASGKAVTFEIWQGPQVAARGQLSRDDA